MRVNDWLLPIRSTTTADRRKSTIIGLTPYRSSIKADLSTGVGNIILSATTKSPELNFEDSGALKPVTKYVDMYDNASATGKYIGASGQISLELPSQTLHIPVVGLWDVASFDISTVISDLGVSASGGGAYDESSAASGEPNVAFEGNADISAGAGAVAGNPDVVSCSVDVTAGGPLKVEASGPGSEYPESFKVEGAVTGGPLTGYITFNAEWFGFYCSAQQKLWTLGTAGRYPIIWTIY